mmetsp:Transcript_1318/g.2995  ORF Transcript_1318/g.2995 Transcript_1318/m.2995 type:complete len:219 (+) Transcript_1318:768-1424(+)
MLILRTTEQCHQLLFACIREVQVLSVVETGLSDVLRGCPLDQLLDKREVLDPTEDAFLVAALAYGKQPLLFVFRQDASPTPRQVGSLVFTPVRSTCLGVHGDGPDQRLLVLGWDANKHRRCLVGRQGKNERRGGGRVLLRSLLGLGEFLVDVGSPGRGGFSPVDQRPAIMGGIDILVGGAGGAVVAAVHHSTTPRVDAIAGEQDGTGDCLVRTTVGGC